MNMSKKVLISTTVASVFASAMTFAAPQETPPLFVKRISDQLVTQLKQNKAQLSNPAILNRIVQQNIEPYIDAQGFASEVMGQYYTNQYTNDAQRDQFTRNFRSSIINTYAKGLAQYNTVTYAIRPYRPNGSQYPAVWVDFNTSNGKIPVAFQLTDKGSQWKIRNINVNGINIAATFRDQFKSTVQRSGGDMNKAIASFKPAASIHK